MKSIATRLAMTVLITLTAAACRPVESAEGAVRITMADEGLGSLTFGGERLLADGTFKAREVLLSDPEGAAEAADLTAGKVRTDKRDNSVTRTYPCSCMVFSSWVSGSLLLRC